MSYILNPTAEFWSEGAVCIPRCVCEEHIKFADENKLKVLLLLASQGKGCSSNELAQKLGIDNDEAAEALEFWENEGVITNTAKAQIAPPKQKEPEKKPYESLPVPSYTPRDIVNICSENEEFADLLRTAEKLLMTGLSNSMKSNLINMVTYYGLPVPVVITLLNYYKSERDNGKNVTTRKLSLMAKEWADEEIKTLEEASDKLQELTSCEELWGEVTALCAFDYRKPTSAQLKMLRRWTNDFEREMIFFACNTMKKYTPEDVRSLKAVDNILKEWKRKGFKTPEDVKSQPKKSDKKSDGRLKSKPSFDIDEIKKGAVLNDDFDI